MRFLRLSARAAEAKAGVSTAQLFVLSQLSSAPAASIRELAERTLTDPSSVSVIVSKLEEQGLVSRAKVQGDKRRAELALTAKGRAVVAAVPDLPQANMLAALEEMSEARRKAIDHALEDLVIAIGAEAVEPRMFFEDEPRKPAKPAKKRATRRVR
ncbi:MAG: MarR family winged helix-turn-helix transcriptional regulator [Polyangiales bacterium]